MKEKAAEVKARLVANAKEVNGVKVVKLLSRCLRYSERYCIPVER